MAGACILPERAKYVIKQVQWGCSIDEHCSSFSPYHFGELTMFSFAGGEPRGIDRGRHTLPLHQSIPIKEGEPLLMLQILRPDQWSQSSTGERPSTEVLKTQVNRGWPTPGCLSGWLSVWQ
jgi:hypothetical protein